MPRNAHVLGVDACRTGWVGIALDAAGAVVAAYHAATIGPLVAAAECAAPLAAVAVDMPIGLPDEGLREADRLARAAAGPRWPSVFMAPVRAALDAEDYRAASAANRRLTGQGLSRQAYALRPKIIDVDRWLRTAGPRVVEAHPELSFAMMAGAPLRTRKTTWSGSGHRRDLLAAEGVHLDTDLGEPGDRAGYDDVLDAAAVAWTAHRVANGRARALPDPPETFGDGIPCAIWT